MTGLGALIRRNVKLYFKDKGMFFTSLITPMILLVLYSTFLGNVYRRVCFGDSAAGSDSEQADQRHRRRTADFVAARNQLRNGHVLLQYADGSG